MNPISTCAASRNEDLARILIGWIEQDAATRSMLATLRELGLPDAYLAAGAIRNLVWDRLHGFESRTPLNDVDVVYFDAADPCPLDSEASAERRLSEKMPGLNWQARNQARMHIRNGAEPYGSVVEAMRGWPETATAVGARMEGDGSLSLVCPWGLDDLFALLLKPSPLCPQPEAFAERVAAKNWLVRWPKLRITTAKVRHNDDTSANWR